jgi:glycosyltransferase involved in cell wall biosynthesis
MAIGAAVDSVEGGAGAARPRRVLVIAHAYPPQPPPGSNRWAAMCRYLEAQGHEVVVLTTSALSPVEPDRRETVRARDLLGAPGLRSLLLRPAPSTGDAPPWVRARARQLVKPLAVPDVRALTWLPFAARAARRLLAGRRFDCVITSSPPHSTQLVGLLAGSRRPPWIVDLRDGWGFEADPPRFPTALQRAANRRLEREVVESADAVVATTRPIAADLASRFGVRARCIPNGWDPELEAAVARAQPPRVRSDRFTFVYTGSFHAPRQDPGPLVEAVRRLAAEEPPGAGRFEVVLAGRLSDAQSRLLTPDLADVIRHVGPLARPEAVALQRRADALLLVLGHGMSGAPGKLAEYLASERPIIVVGSGSEAARIVTETGSGVAVPAGDAGRWRRSCGAPSRAASRRPALLGAWRRSAIPVPRRPWPRRSSA